MKNLVLAGKMFAFIAIVAALATTTIPSFAQAVAPATNAESGANLPTSCIPAPRPEKWWNLRYEELNKRVATPEAKKAKIVFLGDSITHLWEKNGKAVWAKNFAPLGAINLGISGDKTESLLWRLDKGNFPADLDPKLIVLMIGTNNAGLNSDTPEDIARGIKAILERLEKSNPKTKILLLAIFPRGADKNDAARKINEATNKIIKNYADNKRVYWLDINKAFLEKDSAQTLSKAIFYDLLHPTEKGYERWAKEILPKVKQLSH